jgi:N-acetylneuraminic acid mutarotase
MRYGVYLNSTEVYDPSTETWTNTSSMNYARFTHIASVLSNGEVLVTGGKLDRFYDSNTAEIYNPLTDVWTVIDSMNVKRFDHTASVL